MTGDYVTFEAQRGRLFGLAYRLLGEAAEAEDVVQDAWLRWHNSAAVENPPAWLAKVVTNLCLTRLSSARVRREAYVGPWLPEPVFTGNGALGPLETVEQRDSVSVGMLAMLESLSPAERAVFVLKEAFEHSHAEVAEILGVTEEHSRQLLSRARAHVGQRRRFTVDADKHRELLERFLAAAMGGDKDALEDLLAEDVTTWSDGGGKVTAARRPVLGRDKVARLLVGLGRRPEIELVDNVTIEEIGGEPAVVFWSQGAVFTVIVADAADGRIAELRVVVNPDKLAFATTQRR